MKAFEKNELILACVGVCVMPNELKVRTKVLFSLCSLCIFCTIVSTLLASIIFAIKFIAIDLENTLFAVFQVNFQWQ